MAKYPTKDYVLGAGFVVAGLLVMVGFIKGDDLGGGWNGWYTAGIVALVAFLGIRYLLSINNKNQDGPAK